MNDMNAVVAHEHYPTRGGGERVADELAHAFDAPLVTGWVDDPGMSDHEPTEILERTPFSPLRRFFNVHYIRDLFYMFAWESVPTLRDYDVVIQSGNAPTWYVPEEDQTVVKYVHSPPRNPYDLFWREGSQTANISDLLKPSYVANRLYSKAARQWWSNRTSSVDMWVCNSEVVARRTKKYLGVPEEKIRVVYPPVDVSGYSDLEGGPESPEDYYFTISRLEPSKHVDYIIEEFAGSNADSKLIVAGDGNSRGEVEAAARHRDNVEYRGRVSEGEKKRLYAGSKATIFAAENEDFGMVPIESMAAGTPVIGVDEGFTQFQIVNDRNGLLFHRRPGELSEAINTFEFVGGVGWDAKEIREFARYFRPQRFHREMKAVVEEAREGNAITRTKLDEERRKVTQ